MRRLVFLLPIAIVVVLVALFWIGLDPKRDKSVLPSALVGTPAPAVDLPGAGGRRAAPESLSSRGSWWRSISCASGACRAGPSIHCWQIIAEFGVPVIGIAWKDKPEPRTFLQELGDPYVATGIDHNGRTGTISASPACRRPSCGADGTVLYRSRAVSDDGLRNELAPAIAEAKK
jgi:cytochrome c biogenesis protein CcmG/thiol:disulfide interchange protein DsbE